MTAKRPARRTPFWRRKLLALVFALFPWLRRKRVPCGYSGSCGKPAPFSFYCHEHDLGLRWRLAFWWRVWCRTAKLTDGGIGGTIPAWPATAAERAERPTTSMLN